MHTISPQVYKRIMWSLNIRDVKFIENTLLCWSFYSVAGFICAAVAKVIALALAEKPCIALG